MKCIRNQVNKMIAAFLVIALTMSHLALSPTITQAAGKKVTKIKLNQSKMELYVGQTYALKVKSVVPGKASKAVNWKSSNKRLPQ